LKGGSLSTQSALNQNIFKVLQQVDTDAAFQKAYKLISSSSFRPMVLEDMKMNQFVRSHPEMNLL
jgi:hypothetical protein